MVMLFCSFTVFATYSWGRYIMIACVVAIFILDSIKKRFKYKLIFGQFLVITALFALYALISALWAENPSDSIAKGKTLFEIFFMIFVLYNYYDSNQNSVSNLLSLIKWSSFIIVVYSMSFYGVGNLIAMAAAEGRMDNTYANVNTIGMLAAVGILIQIDEIIREKKFKISVLLCIPSVLLLSLTQSRKAFIVLLLGFAMIFILRNVSSENLGKTVLKIVISLIVLIVLLYFILSLPIFSGMMNRMDKLIASLTGIGKVDTSTKLRNLMVEVGWEQFLKNPVLGMGIGNPHILAAKYLGKDAYLHNNFIELLAGGGIVGFSIYYSMYAYLFINFWRYRNFKNKEYILCFTIMFLLFFMDFGRVSYYSKINYIYLMLYFLEVEKLKKNAKESMLGRYIDNG